MLWKVGSRISRRRMFCECLARIQNLIGIWVGGLPWEDCLWKMVFVGTEDTRFAVEDCKD